MVCGPVLHLEAVAEHPVEDAQPLADVHAGRDEGLADLEEIIYLPEQSIVLTAVVFLFLQITVITGLLFHN